MTSEERKAIGERLHAAHASQHFGGKKYVAEDQAIVRRSDLAALLAEVERLSAPCGNFDLATHLQHQQEWSENTFGPGARVKGVIDHIRKELKEIEADPSDLEEWIDVVILALDGAWRSGASPKQIIDQIQSKQAKNEARDWPDWRTSAPDKAIEHVRGEATSAPCRCREALEKIEEHAHAIADMYHRSGNAEACEDIARIALDLHNLRAALAKPCMKGEMK